MILQKNWRQFKFSLKVLKKLWKREKMLVTKSLLKIDWLNGVYGAFNSISVISWQQLTLFMSFLERVKPFPHSDTFWRLWETSLLKIVWEKEKLLVASNFSFSHCVVKRPVSQGRQKVSLCGNGLTTLLIMKGLYWQWKGYVYCNKAMWSYNETFSINMKSVHENLLKSCFVEICILLLCFKILIMWFIQWKDLLRRGFQKNNLAWLVKLRARDVF